MPIYEFINTNTGVVEEHMVKIADVDRFLADNPALQKTMTAAPGIGDSVRLGIRKNDNGWKEVLQRVAEKTPGGKTLNDSIR